MSDTYPIAPHGGTLVNLVGERRRRGEPGRRGREPAEARRQRAGAVRSGDARHRRPQPADRLPGRGRLPRRPGDDAPGRRARLGDPRRPERRRRRAASRGRSRGDRTVPVRGRRTDRDPPGDRPVQARQAQGGRVGLPHGRSRAPRRQGDVRRWRHLHRGNARGDRAAGPRRLHELPPDAERDARGVPRARLEDRRRVPDPQPDPPRARVHPEVRAGDRRRAARAPAGGRDEGRRRARRPCACSATRRCSRATTRAIAR